MYRCRDTGWPAGRARDQANYSGSTVWSAFGRQPGAIMSRNAVVTALILFVAADCCHAVPSPEDQKIDGWMTQIDRSAEKGDFSAVTLQRTHLADYAAAAGHYDLAARQYELLLAA